MFQSARVRLTTWYLIIIALITFSFSAVIYRFVSLELEQGFRVAEYRLRGLPLPQHNVRILLEDELIAAKHTLFIRLLIINGIIIGTAGIAGYFLAGKTLHPIKVMIDEQKRFVADASHELRTPLTAMKSEIEVALRDKKLRAKDTIVILKSNLQEVDKMKELNDYLLSLSRYETNGHDLAMEIVDLGEAARQAIERNKALAKEKIITINEKLSEVVVKGNAQSLVELVSILINNAIKYSGSGTEVTVSVSKQLRHIVLKVKDQGVGIDQRDIPHIFDRFYRADCSRCKTEVDGYGLGLSIAKSIVDVHKGEIKVESKVNKGSSFIVTLPA